MTQPIAGPYRARLAEVQMNVLNAWTNWPDGTPRDATLYWALLDTFNTAQQAVQALDNQSLAIAPPATFTAPADAVALAADQAEHARREAMRDATAKAGS